MKNYFAHDEKNRKEMLDCISISNIEDLFNKIPRQARMHSFELPAALSEMQTQKVVKAIAAKNNVSKTSFIGGGIYNKFIPACIPQVASRFEFLTSYTPYQPEISQGTLQVIYEYQSMICNLTGMEVSNACVYDSASACAEAVLMTSRITKKNFALISDKINPQYKSVIDTYTSANGIEINYVSYDKILSISDFSKYACILIQNPDFYGNLYDLQIADKLHENKALLVVSSDASALSVIKSPAEFDADIAVGELQSLGLPMSFGGPHAGYMACKEQYMRQLPGRIVGRTLDADGNQAFTLTLQTREQHIRREKATSNICSNQSLMALCSTLYLSLLGQKGFKQTGIISASNAHILAEKLKKEGYNILTKDFFNEFVIEVDNADKFLKKLDEQNILGGIKLDNKKILVAATEMNTAEEINSYIKAITEK